MKLAGTMFLNVTIHGYFRFTSTNKDTQIKRFYSSEDCLLTDKGGTQYANLRSRARLYKCRLYNIVAVLLRKKYEFCVH